MDFSIRSLDLIGNTSTGVHGLYKVDGCDNAKRGLESIYATGSISSTGLDKRIPLVIQKHLVNSVDQTVAYATKSKDQELMLDSTTET